MVQVLPPSAELSHSCRTLPSVCGDQVMRAFDAGWGGAVWKTLGDPIVNVSSRYSSIDLNGQRMMGLNNIELITDRPLEVNFREISEVKKRYPHHAVIASLMVDSTREAWHEIVKRAEDAGSDGLELNFGCPHGMSERGMGSAVGQVPEYCSLITEWVKEVALLFLAALVVQNIVSGASVLSITVIVGVVLSGTMYYMAYHLEAVRKLMSNKSIS